MPPRAQLLPDFTVVVYLSVVAHPYLAVVAGHGLPTSFGKIYDREPSVSQSHGPVFAHVSVRIIGSPVRKSIGHGRKNRRFNRDVRAVDSGYAAHFISSCLARELMVSEVQVK